MKPCGRCLRPWLALASLAILAVGCEKAPLAPVTDIPVSAVVVSPPLDTLDVDETAQFTATVYDTLGQPTSGVAVAWISGDTDVFTVTSGGRVRGVGEGTAPLIAAVGAVRDTAFITVLTGGGWVRQVSATTADLNAVFFLPDGRTGWAVGDAGVIVHTTDAGDRWTRQISNTSFTLNGVWFTSETEGYAVGNGGTVLTTSNAGTTWARFNNVGQSEALMDVTFATPDTGWVVGDNGLVLRTFDRGFSWDTFRVPTGFSLEGVAFAGTLDGWAVGGGGVIAGTHDRGVSWYVISPSITIQSLKDVSRRSLLRAFAVGSQGVTPRTAPVGPDSTEWELDNAGSGRQLEGVHYPTDLIGYTVGFDAGLGGIILRTDDGGETWESQSANAAARLNDVFFIDPLRGWAVGQAGTIVHTGRGGKP